MATKAATLHARIPACTDETQPQVGNARHRLLAFIAHGRSEAAERKALVGWGARAEVGRETGARC